MTNFLTIELSQLDSVTGGTSSPIPTPPPINFNVGQKIGKVIAGGLLGIGAVLGPDAPAPEDVGQTLSPPSITQVEKPGQTTGAPPKPGPAKSALQQW